MNKINKRQLKMLLVTSDRNLSGSVKRLTENFQDKRIELCWKKTGRTASQAIAAQDFDVCLIDDRFQNQTGLKLLHRIILEGGRQPLILLTGCDDEKLRLEALQIGAAYCLETNKLDAPLFEQTVNYAVEYAGRLIGLRESVVNHRNLIETLPVMVYAVEPQPPYSPIYISPAFEKFGYPLKEWSENVDFWISSLHPGDRRRILKETDDAMKNNGETDFEYRIISKENSVVWVHDRGRFVYDKAGKAICWQGVLIDISERKRAEQIIREREEQYSELFENANDLIFTRDLEGTFTSLNKVGEIIIGYSRKEILMMNSREIIAPEYLKKAREMTDRILAGEAVDSYELDIISKDGRRNPFEINIRLIKQNGVPVGFQGIARDITERRRAEKFLQISEATLKDLFDNAPIGYHELDSEGRIVRVNRTELEMLGYTAEEMLGRAVWEFVVEPDSRQSVLNKLSGIEPCEPHERNFRRKDGSSLPLLIEEKIISNQGGEITGIRSTVQNIIERKQAEQSLVNSERRYRLLGEGIMHQVWTAQPNGRIDYVNNRTLDYFGQTFEQMVGQGWQSMVHADDLPGCLKRWKHSLATGEVYETEFRLRRHDGEFCWHQARATAGLAADGKIINWFGTNTDINDRKIAEAKLNHFAEHDALTNLPNRTKFMNYLERAISRSEYNQSFRFAVLFLDLDRFKVINDSLGHTTGDKLLVALAKRLEECLRPNDIVARLGGDEFTVLLNNINEPNDAVRIAKRFLEKLSVPFNLDAYEVFTSASIGIIVSDDVKRRPEDFLRDADAAMYRAKEAGKSRYEIFDREMHIRNINLLQMENDLRRAIGQNEFRVFYQPIIHLETGEIREFEALIRWQHPQHGLVPPNDFIGIAEETGLIIPIGRWILEESCRQTVEWQKRFPAYKNLSISVNLSAKQLMHPDLLAQVNKTLRETALKPRFLNLEVTESMVMENGDRALAVISELNKLGIELSTDDFGTGYSSLSYLHRFPFSRLKIDRSFVSKMDSDEKSEAIVRTILLLAQNLNIEVVAEGIENEPQLQSLRRFGCETGQGYFFSKPVPAETAALLLQNGLPNVNSTSFYGFSERDNHQLLELDKVQ